MAHRVPSVKWCMLSPEGCHPDRSSLMTTLTRRLRGMQTPVSAKALVLAIQ
jgi:hypothetical protein